MVIYIDNYDHIFLILVQVKPFSSHPHPNSPQKWFFLWVSYTLLCFKRSNTFIRWKSYNNWEFERDIWQVIWLKNLTWPCRNPWINKSINVYQSKRILEPNFNYSKLCLNSWIALEQNLVTMLLNLINLKQVK